MRRVMICVSVMLAIVQLWPMVFGHHVTPEQVANSAAPGAKAATSLASSLISGRATQPVAAIRASSQRAGTKGQTSCYRHYEIAFAACTPSDRGCRMKAADQWDLCEATGFWGN